MDPEDPEQSEQRRTGLRGLPRWLKLTCGAVVAAAVVAVVFVLVPSARESPEGMGEAIAEAVNDRDVAAYDALLCPSVKDDGEEIKISLREDLEFAGSGKFGNKESSSNVVKLRPREAPEESYAFGIRKEGDEYCVWAFAYCEENVEYSQDPIRENFCNPFAFERV